MKAGAGLLVALGWAAGGGGGWRGCRARRSRLLGGGWVVDALFGGVRQVPRAGSAGRAGEGSEGVERVAELAGPGPAGGEPQGRSSRAVHRHGGHGGEAGASGPVCHGWLVGELGGPVAEVVGQHGTAKPGAVGVVMPRRDVFEPGAFFEITDGELDCGVVAVELVGFDGVEVVSVGDEGVMAPVGPQLSLRGFGQAGAAHNEAHGSLLGSAAGGVDGFGDLGLAADRVVDVVPPIIGDRLDDSAEAGCRATVIDQAML